MNTRELLELLPVSIAKSKEFTKNQKLVLAFLLFKNEMEKCKEDGYFFITNKAFSEATKISKTGILTILRRFSILGFIERKAGRKTVASEYKVFEDVINNYSNNMGNLPILTHKIKGNLPKLTFNEEIMGNLLKRIDDLELTIKGLEEEIKEIKGNLPIEVVTPDTDTDIESDIEDKLNNNINNNLNNINNNLNNINNNLDNSNNINLNNNNKENNIINNITKEMELVETRSAEPQQYETKISILLDKLKNVVSLEEFEDKLEKFSNWMVERGITPTDELNNQVNQIYNNLLEAKSSTISTEDEQSITNEPKPLEIAGKEQIQPSNEEVARVGMQLCKYKRELMTQSTVNQEQIEEIESFIKDNDNVIKCKTSDLPKQVINIKKIIKDFLE